ncbi:MAG: apolipoprotein N-acyltransferase [Bdellovibrionales bacterium]|nr:apolipoprotein N-acyltransferase [Bdellovibrionales bacterium]
MIKSLLLALLSGILYVFSFAPWDQAWLQWIWFVPLLIAVQRIPETDRGPKWIFLIGMVPSVVICLGGFYWMVHATQQYGGLPLPAAIGVFLLFCLTGQLQIPLFLLLRERISKSLNPSRFPFFYWLTLGFLYAGIESLYPKLFLDTAGHAFYHSSHVRQLADIGGPFFLTTIVILFNGLFFRAIQNRDWRPLLQVLMLGSSILAYGSMRIQEYRLSRLEGTTEGPGTTFRPPTLHLSLVQANIGDYLKIAAERGALDATDEVMEKFLSLSSRALQSDPKPDVLVWPETAYPAIFQKPKTGLEQRLDYRLNSFLNDFKGTLAFGGYDSDESLKEYNSLFIYHSPSRKKDVYHKAILLQFGETLPFAENFPSMKEWFPTMGFFGRGPGAELKTLLNSSGESFQIAPSICYEGLFTNHSVNGALMGADALLNITNDSWFGPYGEPYLHLALTQFRSIETRLPLLRSTNTGISVSIDPLGETLESTRVNEETILRASITRRTMKASPYLSVAKILGPDWYVRLCQSALLLVLAMLLAPKVRGFFQSSRS